MKYSSKEEDLLIDLALNGDNLAFKELVERNQETVARVVKGILGDCPEAEDVGQTVFIKFYQSMNNFKKQATLKTYLTRIAINLSINHAKKRQRTLQSGGHEAIPEMNSNWQNDFKAMDDKELIDKALDQLSIEHRSVVVMRLIQGYSTKEAAVMLKIPEGTVLSRLARAQEKLKKLLKPIISLVL